MFHSTEPGAPTDPARPFSLRLSFPGSFHSGANMKDDDTSNHGGKFGPFSSHVGGLPCFFRCPPSRSVRYFAVSGSFLDLPLVYVVVSLSVAASVILVPNWNEWLPRLAEGDILIK